MTAAQAHSVLFDRSSRIGIAGAGKLGSSLALGLSDVGRPPVCVSSSNESVKQEIRFRLPNSKIVSTVQDVADIADIVFLSVPDKVLKRVSDSIRWRKGQAVVHCSGILPISVLENVATTGAVYGGCHPLQTFHSRFIESAVKGIFFGIESNSNELLSWLEECALDLKSETFEISSSYRAIYHASAVMACSLIASMARLAAVSWLTSGRELSDAMRYLRPLTESAINSVHQFQDGSGVTGPLARADVEVLESHLKALNAYNPETAIAYAAVSLASTNSAQLDVSSKDRKTMRLLFISYINKGLAQLK